MVLRPSAVLLPLVLALISAPLSLHAGHAGNARRGQALFTQRGCAACHSVDGQTPSAGPDLSRPLNNRPLTREEFLEAIKEPGKKVREGYELYTVVLADGTIATGRILKETDDSITLVSLSETQSLRETQIARDDIDDIVQQKASLMPQELLKGMREVQIDDLLTYLQSLTNPDFKAPEPARVPDKLPGIDLEPIEADATFYSPEESMKRIHLAPGYRLELVAAEPMIEEPVLCVWDGNNRMYVAEMRTYMQDAEGSDQDLPKSRVTLLEDTDGDGRMDRTTRFAENLVLPRMILPLDDRIIINETYTEDYYSYRDTDGDGVADEKTLLYGGGKAGGNLEHQNSGLTWGIDNWIYTARLGWKRHRFSSGQWKSEQIYGDHGQWGLAMDDLGRFFLSTAGGERPVYGFQQLPQYGRMSLPGEHDHGFGRVYPVVKQLDVQGGLGRVDKVTGTLNHFTGCAGQSIYRGDAMPPDFNGDYILPEPVGRFVRRAKVTHIDGKYVLSNAYDQSEFIASTDKNFRPLWSATGPDGCLYIVDMYRGIIQEGNWTRKGSYLRDVIDKEGFARNIGRGRIYRVVHESTKRRPAPRLLDQSTEELVAHLSHPNGWRRDTAQKLIVLRDDKAVAPQLEDVALHGTVPLGRMHALWTIDGLGASRKAVITAAMKDTDHRVRLAAIRISEPFLADDPQLVQAVGAAGYSDDLTVVVQAINSLRYAKTKAARTLIAELGTLWPQNDIVIASSQNSLNYREGGGPKFAAMDGRMLKKMKQGYQAYSLVCIRCHGPDGAGAISSDGLQLAPPLAGSPRLLAPADVPARIVLHGLTGPVDGRKYPGAMESMKRQDDEWIASALTYVRNSFGNRAPAVDAREVARARAETRERTQPWTMDDFAAYQAVPPQVVQSWTWTASIGDHPEHAADGDPTTRYSTADPQQRGQWLQFDMGQTYEVTSISLDTSGSKDDYPREFEVRVSDDGESWSEPFARGSGTGPNTAITLDRDCFARFVRIIQTGKGVDNFWSVHETLVNGRPSATSRIEFAQAAVDELVEREELSDEEHLKLGQVVYSASCVQCHGRSGHGAVNSDGAPLAPPVNHRSETPRHIQALIRISLKGFDNDGEFCPGLPQSDVASHSRKTAALLSYIRREFHEGLGDVTEQQVADIAAALPDTKQPFCPEDLSEFMPISRRAMSAWKLDASHNAGGLRAAIDGNRNSRYSVNEGMKPGMWITLDLRQDHHLQQIILDTTKSPGDYPRGFEVSLSENGTDWSEPVLTGNATSPVTEFILPRNTLTRHVKIEQTGTHGLFWSIHELLVYGQPVE